MITPRSPSGRGFTLIELMVGLAIFAVLAALAAPSMLEMIARKRVEGAVDELLVDFRQAKAAQIASNVDVVVAFNANTDMTCYTIHEKQSGFGNCDCRRTATPVCSSMTNRPPREFKTARYPRSRGVTVLPADTSPTTVTLDKLTGLPLSETPLQIVVSAPRGGTVKVSTNSAGMARACSVAGHDIAYKACTP